jgi:hypothetical protein
VLGQRYLFEIHERLLQNISFNEKQLTDTQEKLSLKLFTQDIHNYVTAMPKFHI